MGPVAAERLHLRCEVLDEDVQVAHGAERSAQPLQLVSHRIGPRGIEELAAGPLEGPESSRRDAHLMQLLGLGPSLVPGSWAST